MSDRAQIPLTVLVAVSNQLIIVLWYGGRLHQQIRDMRKSIMDKGELQILISTGRLYQDARFEALEQRIADLERQPPTR